MCLPVRSFFRLCIVLLFILQACSDKEPPNVFKPEDTDDDFRVEWLKTNAIPISTIDPMDEDYSDLNPLRTILQDVNIIMLGEQSHGDGTTFSAKVRLIKFLHQELGFDVLAFESSFYGCTKSRLQIQEGMPVHDACKASVFPIWSHAIQVFPLFDYMENVKSGFFPIELTGFDCRLDDDNSCDYMLNDLENFLQSSMIQFDVDDWAEFRSIADQMIFYPETTPDDTAQSFFFTFLDKLQHYLSPHQEDNEDILNSGAFWNQLLKSMRQEAQKTIHDDLLEAINIRDAQLADNLMWLIHHLYPDRKIIVWAATFHILRDIHRIDNRFPRSYEGLTTMGHILHEQMGDDIYALGFTSYAGEANMGGTTVSINPASANSFEDFMLRAGFDLAMVDFEGITESGDWLKEPLMSRPLGHAEMIAIWPLVLDGMMFTRTVEPSIRVN